jgi:hypothetical protein
VRGAIAAEGGEFRKSPAARKLSDEQLEEAVRLYRESDLPVHGVSFSMRNPNGHTFEKPKNGKGRSVKLSQKALESLRSHRTAQNEERLASTKWQDNGLVFPTTTGTTVSCTNLQGDTSSPCCLVRVCRISGSMI